MHFLITAGATRQYLDPVRFISNASSGRMGLTLARAALRRGHEVTLVVGPVQARLPGGARTVRVETTEQMARACFEHFGRVDCVIMSAAVCDFEPAICQASKIKKQEDQSELNLQLKPTVDILAELGKCRKHQVLIGFALESDKVQANALAKLKRKRHDYIVSNTPVSIGSDSIDAAIISADGSVCELGCVSKRVLAGRIIRIVEGHGAKAES